MADKPDELLPSAKDIMQKIALAEAEEASKEMRLRAEAEAERKALVDQLTKPSGLSDEEAIARAIKIIERAINNRLTEVQVHCFPNQLCTDKGRAINGARLGEDAHRRPEGNLSTVGQVFSLARLQAQSTDHGFSGGMPGDVGM